MITIIFSVFCFIGPALIWGLFLLVARMRSSKAVGTIIGHDSTSAPDGGNDMYAPIVEFQLPDGKKITFTEKEYVSKGIESFLFELFVKHILKRDTEKINVLYDPKKPQEARVETFSTIYFAPVFLFVIGVCIILYSIPMFSNFLTPIFDFIGRIAKIL